MLVTFRETNYKMIEVPDGTSLEALNDMIATCDVIIADTNDTEYAVKMEGCEDFISLRCL